jgi:hypothetical protein
MQLNVLKFINIIFPHLPKLQQHYSSSFYKKECNVDKMRFCGLWNFKGKLIFIRANKS